MCFLKNKEKLLPKYKVLFLCGYALIFFSQELFAIPAPEINYGWKLTFEDNFESKESAIARGVDPKCFEGPIGCSYYSWRVSKCDESHLNPGMKHFNRCTWNIWSYANSMGQGPRGSGTGLNSFHPKAVDIIDDKLYLKALRSNVSVENESCKKIIDNPIRTGSEVEDIQCLVWSGGISSASSYYFDSKMKGFSQEYGRFEVRAKISYGPGSWPAIWLTPQSRPVDLDPSCHIWPYAGEIDIMEAWEKYPNRYSTSYHGGVCIDRLKYEPSADHYATSQLFPDLNTDDLESAFYQTFNTYAVEWDRERIRYFFNDRKVYELEVGEGVDVYHYEGPERGKPAGKARMRVPREAFFIRLNNTISNWGSRSVWESLQPGEKAGAHLDYIIDYVRVYRKCTIDDNPKDCYFPNKIDDSVSIDAIYIKDDISVNRDQGNSKVINNRRNVLLDKYEPLSSPRDLQEHKTFK